MDGDLIYVEPVVADTGGGGAKDGARKHLVNIYIYNIAFLNS
jgi:hypothetical protein